MEVPQTVVQEVVRHAAGFIFDVVTPGWSD